MHIDTHTHTHASQHSHHKDKNRNKTKELVHLLPLRGAKLTRNAPPPPPSSPASHTDSAPFCKEAEGGQLSIWE